MTSRDDTTVVLDVVPTPYRASLYRDTIAEGVPIEVFFYGKLDAFATWSDLPLEFPHSFLPGLHWTIRGANELTYHLNVGVVALLLRRRPRVVVLPGWIQPTSVLAVLTCRVLRIPYVVASESHSRRERGALARIYRILVASPVVRGAASSMGTGSLACEYLIGLGAREGTVSVRPNACDVDTFERESERARNDGRAAELRERHGRGRPLVLFAGRLVGVKGVDVLLAALARLRREGNEPSCLIVGRGPEERALKRLAGALELEHVTFVGEVAPPDLPAHYAAADAFCLPSFDEPWGVVVNEAMASGLPVILSDRVGAGPDLVVEGSTGTVVPAGDERALAAALRDVLAFSPEATRDAARLRVRDWGYPRAIAGLRQALARATLPSR